MAELSHPWVIDVVDDDDEDNFLITFELQENGFDKDLHIFSDIKELIDFYNSHEIYFPPALILVNPFIHGINIRKAIDIIKGVPTLRTIPIVLMLGSHLEKVYLRSQNLQVSGYIEKPINGRIIKRFLGIR